VYHSPCELGRGSGVYNDPKEVLNHVSRLEKSNFEDENSLCCGGSLANMKISSQNKKKIAFDAVSELTKNKPDILATACPLCKKTFSSVTETRVADISEIVAEALIEKISKNINSSYVKSVKELANI
jgi:Fe-S oxidoreductase